MRLERGLRSDGGEHEMLCQRNCPQFQVKREPLKVRAGCGMPGLRCVEELEQGATGPGGQGVQALTTSKIRQCASADVRNDGRVIAQPQQAHFTLFEVPRLMPFQQVWLSQEEFCLECWWWGVGSYLLG